LAFPTVTPFCFMKSVTKYPTKIPTEDMTSMTQASSYEVHSPRGTPWNGIFKCGCCLPKHHHEEERNRSLGLEATLTDTTGMYIGLHCLCNMTVS
jgi:hypothetical protein